MKVTVDPKKCISCGMCASVAPDIFALDGTAKVIKDPSTFTGEDKKKAKEAASMCPVGAIVIEED